MFSTRPSPLKLGLLLTFRGHGNSRINLTACPESTGYQQAYLEGRRKDKPKSFLSIVDRRMQSSIDATGIFTLPHNKHLRNASVQLSANTMP